MFLIILVFILKESVDRSDNPFSRRNMNSRIVTMPKRTRHCVRRPCQQAEDINYRTWTGCLVWYNMFGASRSDIHCQQS